MKKILEAIDIDVPIEVVFDFVADFSNALLWMEGFSRFDPVTPQCRGLGAAVRASGTMRGVPITTDLTITEFVPNAKLVSTSDSGLKSRSSWIFEPTQRGTRVTFVGSYEVPGGMARGLASLAGVNKELSNRTWQSLKNLKQIMETKFEGDFNP